MEDSIEEETTTQNKIIKAFMTYEDANSFIESHEREHGYKYVCWKVAPGFGKPVEVVTSRSIRFPTDEIPYIHIRNGRVYRNCNMGGPIKKRASTMSPASLITGKKKRKYLGSNEEERNMPVCPAMVTIRCVIIYPQFDVSSTKAKKGLSKVTETLRKTYSPEIPHETLFIVEINDNHSYHRKKVQTRLDLRVQDEMQRLVEKGHFASNDLQERLMKYVASLPENIDMSNENFYPGIERIRKLSYFHIVRHRNLEREKGFTHDMEDALEYLKELEAETETSFLCYEDDGSFGQHDVYQVAKSKQIYTAPDQELRCKLDTEGVPYVVLETKHYECSHGVEYKNKYYHPYTASQRKHLKKDGMVMCTARCTFREVALFPGYRIPDEFTQRHVREQILRRLREDLRNRSAQYERVIAFAFPVIEEHSGHPVREANGHLFLDEKIKSQIRELVSEGVKSISEMRRHIKMYLKHAFDEESMPGPFNKKYRPSSQTIMNLMYDAGLPPEDIVQDVSDPVPYVSKPSLYRDISTRLEERRKRNEATAALSLITDSEGIVETTYDALIDNLDMFQSTQASPTKPSHRPLPTPVKGVSGLGAPGNDDKQSTEFSDVLFKKQSECQTIMEELLQMIYEVSDMFRLRDLSFHLKKVRDCVKAGRLLCDVIPLRKKKPATSDTAEATYTATPTNPEDGQAPGTSTEEPPTKLVIMDQNEQVTEVDLPKDYDQSEIVIYQENDENGGEQLYLVDQNSFKEEIIQPKPSSVKPFVTDDVKKKQEHRDELRKDMIKVICKQYFPKEAILKNLQVNVRKRHAPVKISTIDDEELKDQEEELKRFENENFKINMMDMKVTKQMVRNELLVNEPLEVDTSRQLNECTESGINGNADDPDMDDMDKSDVDEGDREKSSTIGIGQDHLYSGTLRNESPARILKVGDVSDDEEDMSGADMKDESPKVDRLEVNPKEKNSNDDDQNMQDKTTDSESVKTEKDLPVTPNAKDADNSVNILKHVENFHESNSTQKKVNTFYVAHMRKPKDAVKKRNIQTIFPTEKQKIAISKHKSMKGKPSPGTNTSISGTNTTVIGAPAASLPVKLKPGDTITFPPGTTSPLMTNTGTANQLLGSPGMAGGLLAINNVLYTNTPFGLFPCMPVVLGGQGQALGTGGMTLPTTGTGGLTLPTSGTGGMILPTTGIGSMTLPTTATGSMAVPSTLGQPRPVGPIQVANTGIQKTITTPGKDSSTPSIKKSEDKQKQSSVATNTDYANDSDDDHHETGQNKDSTSESSALVECTTTENKDRSDPSNKSDNNKVTLDEDSDPDKKSPEKVRQVIIKVYPALDSNKTNTTDDVDKSQQNMEASTNDENTDSTETNTSVVSLKIVSNDDGQKTIVVDEDGKTPKDVDNEANTKMTDMEEGKEEGTRDQGKETSKTSDSNPVSPVSSVNIPKDLSLHPTIKRIKVYPKGTSIPDIINDSANKNNTTNQNDMTPKASSKRSNDSSKKGTVVISKSSSTTSQNVSAPTRNVKTVKITGIPAKTSGTGANRNVSSSTQKVKSNTVVDIPATKSVVHSTSPGVISKTNMPNTEVPTVRIGIRPQAVKAPNSNKKDPNKPQKSDNSSTKKLEPVKKDQVQVSVKDSGGLTDSPSSLSRTRGRKMRFSKSGEKLD